MSFVEAFEQPPVLGPDQAPPTVPRDFGERFNLNWKAARSPDQFWFYESRMAELYGDALDKLRNATGQSLPNPFSYRVSELPPEQRISKSAPGRDRESLRRNVHDAFDKAREAQWDLPDPRQFDFKIAGEARALRMEAEKSALVSYGAGGLGAFLGAAGGELSHPAQLATLPLGAGYAAGNMARLGLLSFVGRAALTEAGVAAGAQLAVEAINTPYQEELRTTGPGSGNEPGDRVARILMAGAGGALLGTGLAGLLGIARTIRKAGREITLDEADAIKVAERIVRDEASNPLGPSGTIAHSDALKKAEIDVSAGRHADVDEIVRGEVARQAKHEPPVQVTRVKSVRMADGMPDKHPNGTHIYGDSLGRYELWKDGEFVGKANLQKDKQSIDLIEIERKFRRKGYATGLLQAIENDLGRQLPRSSQMLPDGVDFRNAYDARRAPSAAPIIDPKYRDTLSAIRDAEDLGEEVTAKWLASATGVNAKEAEKIIARLQKDGILGEPDAAGIHSVDLGRMNALLLPEAPITPAKPFDILDSAAATRPIADKAPVVPEKAAATKVAENAATTAKTLADEKPGMKVTVVEGEKTLSAKEAMEAADNELKEANFLNGCAKGIAI